MFPMVKNCHRKTFVRGIVKSLRQASAERYLSATETVDFVSTRTPPSAIEERIPHQQQKRTIDAFLFQNRIQFLFQTHTYIMTMLSERHKQPEMDCQTDFRKELTTEAIRCTSESPNNIDSSTSSGTGALVKAVSHSDLSNSEPKPEQNTELSFRSGRWTPDEKILFLHGLKIFGKGRWKKISIYLPQRSLVQIKSHAQKVLKRQEAGENIFRRLEENINEIDNLVVQAARQRDALRQAGINVNTPTGKGRKSAAKSVAKKKRMTDLTTTTPESISRDVPESVYHVSSSNPTTVPMYQSSDSSVLAAAALCQLSAIGASWGQQGNGSRINEKGHDSLI